MFTAFLKKKKKTLNRIADPTPSHIALRSSVTWGRQCSTSSMLLASARFLLRIASDLNVCRAEVIKIEHPTRGDDTRAWGPPWATYTADSGKEGPGESAYFLAVSGFQLSRRASV